MRHQLILIDGQSTVGKSSISKNVFGHIARQTAAYWLHEECQNHPIRQEEFTAGDIHTDEGMEQNRRAMLAKWEKFRDTIEQGNRICVAEGCFLHAIDRYLLKSAWDHNEMLRFCQQITDVLKPLNPLIIFLYRPNIRESFEKAFSARGAWWKELILSVPEASGYFESHKYTGDDSVFASIAYEQEQIAKVFAHLPCDRMEFDTTGEQWDQYVRHIVEAAGYEYRAQENVLHDLKAYCGTYQKSGGTDTWSIHFDAEKNELYTALFWPYMPMKYTGEGIFELVSFPITLQFAEEGDQQHFKVSGNYDWEYNESLFYRR